MQTKHTPTPWRQYESPLNEWIGATKGGQIVCDKPSVEYGDSEHWQANAAFICRAVNSHEALVEALADLLNLACTGEGITGVVRRARAALKLAKGEG